ncbi:NAD(P)H-dependent oxidoreductase [Rhizobium sp. FKY42]|uniref:NADPH-dependent FMN reductase n=1 Tax=Rhizobium sp. FKY42 TaxID=2562310 RepID=UPI0014855339|nr:NAD(P)H-dependent oxidoreductase [Rhizobium sp. FKY42]
MQLGLIIGSNRKKSQSRRLADFIDNRIKSGYTKVETEIFDLAEIDVPLWSEDKWNTNSEVVKNWAPTSRALSEKDGFVVISPEWAGMATPHLKNFLLMCDSGEVAHKPGLIVAVSSGLGGAYPVSELRSSGYKNNFIWWLPDHLIIRKVDNLFLSEEEELSDHLVKRIDYSLKFLIEASVALAPVRKKCQDLSTYPYGM